MRHTLLIPLAGPMQAWGSRSRFDDRDTHPEPTKSGVLGLVCAALGRGRSERLDDLAALRFGVRVEEAGIALSDFQTAQGVLRAASTGTSTVTSHRHYLSDARFLVGLEGESLDLLRDIEAALRSPRWLLALGRKSYPLTLPPYLPGGSIREGVGLEDALQSEPWRPLCRRRDWEPAPAELRILVEDPAGEHGVLADVPLGYADRRFGLRRTTALHLTTVEEGEPWCTYPS